MVRLSLDANDVAELTALLTLAGADDGPLLPWEFLVRLKNLIGCDAMGANGLDATRQGWYFEQFADADEQLYSQTKEGEDVFPREDEEPFWDFYWDSLPCSYPDTTGDTRSVTSISDFYSQRQWRAHPMYLSAWGAEERHEHELMLCLRDGAGRTFRLLCFRGPGADFCERERLLLTLLRPHIGEAYRAAKRRQATAVLTARQLQILTPVGEGLTNREIGRQLGMSEATVRTHLSNIFTRLGVTSRSAAVAKSLVQSAID